MTQMQQSTDVDALITESTGQAIAGLVTEPYDTVEVTYTTLTKEFVDTVVFKNGGVAVATITATYPSNIKEIYTRT